MKVEFTDYALGRMHMRDILIEETLDILKLPKSITEEVNIRGAGK